LAPPATAATAAPASAPAPAEPSIPTVDDIAFDLRRDLPSLPISMQVYSSDPARRFIIVDGERKKEGDAIRDVAIREIRSNGVVLEFRGQRFLLPRPGS
jgi:general secretion pathway protein B